MYHKITYENWLQKGIRVTEGALKIYGSARGLYEAGSAIASGVRSAYQIAGPALAML